MVQSSTTPPNGGRLGESPARNLPPSKPQVYTSLPAQGSAVARHKVGPEAPPPPLCGLLIGSFPHQSQPWLFPPLLLTLPSTLPPCEPGTTPAPPPCLHLPPNWLPAHRAEPTRASDWLQARLRNRHWKGARRNSLFSFSPTPHPRRGPFPAHARQGTWGWTRVWAGLRGAGRGRWGPPVPHFPGARQGSCWAVLGAWCGAARVGPPLALRLPLGACPRSGQRPPSARGPARRGAVRRGTGRGSRDGAWPPRRGVGRGR